MDHDDDPYARRCPAAGLPPEFAECYAAAFAPIAGQLAVYLGSADEAQDVHVRCARPQAGRDPSAVRLDPGEAWLDAVRWEIIG
ncbi:hypothetical protein [Dactylosporangium sp. CA-233914]|uniref:hypothetical protein n=1 Tax=Dactylosporangium sp. CA-233914 TaxID=3239934 RepID=UPI003D93827F